MSCGDPMPQCTCGPYWSVIPPGPCPYHHVEKGWTYIPYTPPVTSTGTVTWTPQILRDVLGWAPRKPFADGVIPQIGWRKP